MDCIACQKLNARYITQVQDNTQEAVHQQLRTMDTPYNRKVPVPPSFRRPQKARSLFHLPKARHRSASWSIYILLGFAAYVTAYWYNTSDTRSHIGNKSYEPQYTICSDLDEVRAIAYHLEENSVQLSTNVVIPNLATVMANSADAISAANSFVVCHDGLALELSDRDKSCTGCDTLFERMLSCHYQFTKFHEHHKRALSVCEDDILKQIKGDVGDGMQGERNQDGRANGERAPRFWYLDHLKDAVRNHMAPRSTRNQKAGGEKTDLSVVLNRVRDLCAVQSEAEPYRQNIRDTYGQMIQLFVAVSCGQTGSRCLCESIDLVTTKKLYRQAASEVNQLTSKLSDPGL